MPRPKKIAAGQTVQEQKATKMLELIQSGMPVKKVERQLSVTLESLRKSGAVNSRIKALLEEATLTEAAMKEVARARATELMLQDDDLKVAARMTKACMDYGQVTPAGGTTFNIAMVDPEVIKALKSLKLEVEGLIDVSRGTKQLTGADDRGDIIEGDLDPDDPDGTDQGDH